MCQSIIELNYFAINQKIKIPNHLLNLSYFILLYQNPLPSDSLKTNISISKYFKQKTRAYLEYRIS